MTLDRAAEIIVELCATRIPRRFGFDPINDIIGALSNEQGKRGSISPEQQVAVGSEPFRPC